MDNSLSYYGLVYVRINASDKDLPVQFSSLVSKFTSFVLSFWLWKVRLGALEIVDPEKGM